MTRLASRLRRHLPLFLLSLALTSVLATAASPHFRPAWLNRLELLSYDQRLGMTLSRRVDRRIVIVDIDERSLQQEGRWPWPRDRLAEMVDILFDRYQIRILGFDVVFAEPDTNPGIAAIEALSGESAPGPGFLQSLRSYAQQVDRDRHFAHSLRDRPVVLGYYFQNQANMNAGTRTGELPMPVLPTVEAGMDGLPLNRALGYGANLPVLQQAARGGGFFDNPRGEGDGSIRSVPMLVDYQGNLYESLSLAMTRTLLDAWFIEPQLEYDNARNVVGLGALKVGDLTIRVDDSARALVPYLGPQGSFPYVSAGDVLRQRADPDLLRDAIVLVGTSSPGLLDLRATPVQSVYPGVEIHANLIAGMLDQRIPHQPGYAVGVELVGIVLIGVLLTLLSPWLSAVATILVTLAIAAATVGANLIAWHQGLVFPLASQLLTIGVLFALHMAYGFITETRLKRHISRTFGHYVPPQLVDELLEQPQHLEMKGESRRMTVLFSDVRGFTSLSEGLSPTELTALMNAMLTRVTQVIHQRRGTIDKYMGDAVMAFWGAPLHDPNHARHAVQAALDMVSMLPELHDHFAKRGWPPIRFGIGINSGEMNVGNMGSEFRVAYTVLGDAVNLGSRLEGVTKHYAVPVIVSEHTRALAPGFVYRELDRVLVWGKDEPVSLYQPLAQEGRLDVAALQLLERYQGCLAAYRARDWASAREGFAELAAEAPDDGLFTLYLRRSEAFLRNPPDATWDGIHRFDHK